MTRSRFIHGGINQQHRDSLARLLDQPQPTTFADAARMTVAPTMRAIGTVAHFITRHARASAAAVRAYRSVL